MDWLVLSSDLFLASALMALTLAPVAGAALQMSRALTVAVVVGFAVSWVLLGTSLARTSGGIAVASAAHAVLLVSALSLAMVGRVVRAVIRDEMASGFAALMCGGALTVGAFVAGPFTADWPLWASRWVLTANPLVTVASAAGIDLLHIDTIYRLSPLAHRGVALTPWPVAVTMYAVFGATCYGASRLRIRSTQLT